MTAMETKAVLNTVFNDSYKAYKQYPKNLLQHLEFDPNLLLLYETRLSNLEETLFESPTKFKIPIRDIKQDGKVSKANLLDIYLLKTWLVTGNVQPGLGSTSHSDDGLGSNATEDPRCRFMSVPVPVHMYGRLW